MTQSKLRTTKRRKLLLWAAGPLVVLIAALLLYLNRVPTNEELAERYAIALSTGQTKGIEKYIAPWELRMNNLSRSQGARIIRDGLHPMLQGYKYERMIDHRFSARQLQSQAVFVKDGKEWPVTIYVERIKDRPYIFLGLTACSMWQSEYMLRDKHGESEINYRKGSLLGQRRDVALLKSLGLKGYVTVDPSIQDHVVLWEKRESRLARELAEYGVQLDK